MVPGEANSEPEVLETCGFLWRRLGLHLIRHRPGLLDLSQSEDQVVHQDTIGEESHHGSALVPRGAHSQGHAWLHSQLVMHDHMTAACLH